MDVVADAAAVRGGVVGTEDLYLLELAAGDLADDGHEVVGDAFGVFANSAAGVRANRIEVTQDADTPAALRARQVKEHLLDHGFAVAVGVGGLDAFLLGDGYALGVTVNCRRGAEYQGFAVVLLHTLQEADCGIEVVIVIAQRLGDGFAHGFEAGEVDDGVEAAGGEYLGKGCLVAEVDEMPGEVFTRELAHSVQGLLRTIAKIIDDADFEAGFEQGERGVRADVSSATGEEYLCHIKDPLRLR